MEKIKLWKILILNFRVTRVRLWMSHSLRYKVKVFLETLLGYSNRCLTQTFPSLVRKIRKNNFPITIMIETVSFCNARCIICPAYEVSKELPQGRMLWELYKKIVDECSKHRGLTISPYLTNEPLLDEDIINRVRYAKERIPHVKVFLNTNASLLTQDMTHQLLKYVDSFVFSVLGTTKQDYEKMMSGLNFEKTMENIDYFIRYKKEKGLKSKVMIRYIISNNFLLMRDSVKQLKKIYNFWNKKGIDWRCDLFSTRAGNVVNFQCNTKQIKYLSGCWFANAPLKYIHIIFNGDVVLCNMDCRREIILGNINEKSIYEIWNSQLYNDIRDKIYSNKNKESKDNFLCNRCIDPYFNIY